jgi:hypothetical protein
VLPLYGRVTLPYSAPPNSPSDTDDGLVREANEAFDRLLPNEQADTEMTDPNRVDTIRNDQEVRMTLDECLPGVEPPSDDLRDNDADLMDFNAPAMPTGNTGLSPCLEHHEDPNVLSQSSDSGWSAATGPPPTRMKSSWDEAGVPRRQ